MAALWALTYVLSVLDLVLRKCGSDVVVLCFPMRLDA